MDNVTCYKDCVFFQTGLEHRTHVDGSFYQMPDKFPCVLHDRNGCLCLSREQYSELVSMDHIRESTGGAKAKINIRGDISKLQGYQLCTQKSNCPKYKAKKK